METLKDTVAVVTGASRGIGKAIALELAKAGCHLSICSRKAETLSVVKQEIESLGGKCFHQALDVRNEDAVTKYIEGTVKSLGQPHILVNNAGIYITEPIQNHSLQLWQDVLDINLTGPFLLSRAVVGPMMQNGWGRIINISSVSGKVAEINGGAYSASKFGLIGLTQSLALETAKFGVTVNAICPGWVSTEMSHEQLSDEKYLSLNQMDQQEALDVARLSVPQMRFIEPIEVAQLVVYLCSEQAKGIHGQAINICGGLSLH